MKILPLFALSLLLLAFSACGGNENSEPAETTVPTIAQTIPPTTVSITTEATPGEPTEEPAPFSANVIIRNTVDPMLPAFENYPTEIDFVALLIAGGSPAEHFDWVNPNWGIVIISDEPLYDLQLITIGHNWEAYPLEWFITAVLDEIDVLPANTPLILSRFFLSGGVAPMEGISFTDSNGIRRNMGIMDNRRDNDPPYFFVPFENVVQQ